MVANRFIKMIDATFTYFQSLADWHRDPDGLDAVQQVRTRMINDLTAFKVEPSRTELIELCRRWRAQRIEAEGSAQFPPDMFIESVCQFIELA